jgi:hypothetical protein
VIQSLPRYSIPHIPSEELHEIQEATETDQNTALYSESLLRNAQTFPLSPNGAVPETLIQNAQTFPFTGVQEPIAQYNESESEPERTYAFPYIDSQALLHTVPVERSAVTTSEIEEAARVEESNNSENIDNSTALSSSERGQTFVYTSDEMVARARQRLGLPVYARGETLDDDAWSKRVLVRVCVCVMCARALFCVCAHVCMCVCVVDFVFEGLVCECVCTRREMLVDDAWSKHVLVGSIRSAH